MNKMKTQMGGSQNPKRKREINYSDNSRSKQKPEGYLTTKKEKRSTCIQSKTATPYASIRRHFQIHVINLNIFQNGTNAACKLK